LKLAEQGLRRTSLRYVEPTSRSSQLYVDRAGAASPAEGDTSAVLARGGQRGFGVVASRGRMACEAFALGNPRGLLSRNPGPLARFPASSARPVMGREGSDPKPARALHAPDRMSTCSEGGEAWSSSRTLGAFAGRAVDVAYQVELHLRRLREDVARKQPAAQAASRRRCASSEQVLNVRRQLLAALGRLGRGAARLAGTGQHPTRHAARAPSVRASVAINDAGSGFSAALSRRLGDRPPDLLRHGWCFGRPGRSGVLRCAHQ